MRKYDKFSLFCAAFVLGAAACSSQDSTCLEGASSDGCGEGGSEPALGQNDPLALDAIEAELGIGSQGDAVRAVHAYLTEYGYFPNDELKLNFPRWRPIVEEAPANPAIYDELTARAVAALQVASGLKDTGIVDSETLALLRTPRCGVPDGIRDIDPSYKYAQIGTRWPSGSLSWRVTEAFNANVSGGTGTVLEQVTAAARAAFNTWAAQSEHLDFEELTSGTPDIAITFQNLPGEGLGRAFGPGSGAGGDIVVDSVISPGVLRPWTVSTPTQGANYDLQTLLLHEIGHALGLAHSSIPNAVMESGQNPATQRRATTLDDNVGISSLFDQFDFQVPGSARDIAIGGSGSVWIISTTSTGNGNFAVQKRVGDNFEAPVDGGGGVRIAVGPGNRPWVLDSGGGIWRRSSTSTTSGSWGNSPLPGCATDIGGTSLNGGAIWIIGCTAVTGGHRIFKWDEASGSFLQANNGAAWRIAVNNEGIPWVVDNGGNIYWRSLNGDPSNRHDAGTWTKTRDGLAADIGVGPMDYPWIIGTHSGSGGSVFVWNNQDLGGGDPPAPDVEGWLQVPGVATAVAVDSLGRPWVVSSGGGIFKPLL